MADGKDNGDPGVGLYYFRLLKAGLRGIGVALLMLETCLIAVSVQGVSGLSLTVFLFSLVVAVPVLIVCLVFVLPIASLLAWRPYLHGDRSYLTYVMLGIIAALPVLLPLALFYMGHGDYGRGDFGTTLLDFLFGPIGIWVAVSGGFSGWSFARQINKGSARP